MKTFKLKEEYITSVPENSGVMLILPTGEKILGESYSTIDHPKFTKLRNKLEKEGFITTQRHWWNGDRVLKSFSLNGMEFKSEEQFPCATAMSIRLEIKKQNDHKRKKSV